MESSISSLSSISTLSPNHDKAFGSIFGAFVGDAAGAVLEFIRSEIKPQ